MLYELQDAFQEIDQSKTGFVTAQDISDAMRRNGYEILGEEILRLMRNIDYIGHGKLNYTQFLIAAIDRKRIIDEEGMWLIFKHFDINETGTIKTDELKFALEKAGCFISDGDFNEIIDEFQLKAKDGMNFEDFKDIMTCFSEENSIMVVESEEDGFKRPKNKRLSQRRLTIRRTTRLDTMKDYEIHLDAKSDFHIEKDQNNKDPITIKSETETINE